MAINWPERLSLAHTPTPIYQLSRLSEDLGVPLYVKRDDLTGMELSGNKVRKLEFLVAEAMNAGADTLVTCGGVQSNHCRATAAAAIRAGLQCHLILRGEEPAPPYDGNLLLDRLMGATVSFLSQPEYEKGDNEDFAGILEALRKKGQKPFYIPVGGSVPTGCWGYARAFEELTDQLRARSIRRARLVSAIGSGGTHAGLLFGRAMLERKNYTVTGFNVCNTPELFKEKSRMLVAKAAENAGLDITLAEEDLDVIGGYVGPGYAQPYPELMETIRDVARTEALILDPVYTGKAFHGLLCEIRAGRIRKDEPIVFIHTGGAFGLFPQREHIVY